MTTYTTNYKLPKPDFGAANWHSDMYDALGMIDAVLATFTSIASLRGRWAVSTLYAVGDTTVDPDTGYLYECDVGHTSASSGTFAADRTANPSNWSASEFSARANAEAWADNDEDDAVETGRFSAKHWAIKASAAVGGFTGDSIKDADTDTYVRTEQTADEDKVRMGTGGTERVVVDSNGLNVASGKLQEGGTNIEDIYAAIAHESDTANPHSVTKTQVSLGNVTDDAQLKIASNLLDLGSTSSARSNLGLGSAATHAIVDVFPIGGIVAFGKTSAPSASWLICNGAAVNRTTYADLFAAISTNFGVGDGSTTFNLPDLRGRSIIGYDPDGTGRTTGAYTGGVNAGTMGGTGGEQAHTQTEAELVNHVHPENGLNNLVITSEGSGGNVSTLASNTAHNTSGTGGGNPFNVVQPSQIVAYYIKAL